MYTLLKQIASVFLGISLASCVTWEPYWVRNPNACEAPDDKITIVYTGDIYQECKLSPSTYFNGISGCTIRHKDTCSAEIFISALTTVDVHCAVSHEWRHAKGWDHKEGATDCSR